MARTSTTDRSRSALPRADESAAAAQRAAAGLALRTIFLNLFRYNSARLNSARYESRWRCAIVICCRDGEPVPCPAAVGRERVGRAGHQVEIELSVSSVDPSLITKMRVDDAVQVVDFPPVRLVRGYPKELRALLDEQFGLSYPKVEDEPLGPAD